MNKADGNAAGLKPIRSVWLDVEREKVDPGDPEETATPANPVFNVHTGHGAVTEPLPDGQGNLVDKRVCTFPEENCARFNAYGKVTAQQGRPIQKAGAERSVGTDIDGSIVWIAGHLHPGGVRDEVSLVRNGVEKPVFTSEAIGWNRQDPSRGGGPTDSWDFSMTATGAQYGYKVEIKPGDKLRINATYESDISWYENMGIVVAMVAPDDTSGTDPFTEAAEIRDEVPLGAPIPPGAHRQPTCPADADTLCIRGAPTHGHLTENFLFGGGGGQVLPDAEGVATDVIPVSGFSYGPAALGVIDGTGRIPELRVGETVTFVNADTGADVWHTVTRCKEPCTGATGLAYPKADGGLGPADTMDFDSSEIGFGLFLSPAKAHLDESLTRFGFGVFGQPYGAMNRLVDDVDDGVLWRFTPSAPGTYTFFCRIHNSMRGAVQVVS